MCRHKRIRIKGGILEAWQIRLQSKFFILIKGRKGYIMCGYLNLSSASKVKDVAVKVTGVGCIEDVLKAKATAVTYSARQLGIFPGQPIKEILSIIA
ncbi:MAG: DUF1805 domain-containing protein [Candidatus Omnitrophota bacterium]|nr:DUF1805 domain-containing protein [Candidatus Omnitrophota bacterium]